MLEKIGISIFCISVILWYEKNTGLFCEFGKNESFLNDWGDFVKEHVCIEKKKKKNRFALKTFFWVWTILLGLNYWRKLKNVGIDTWGFVFIRTSPNLFQ